MHYLYFSQIIEAIIILPFYIHPVFIYHSVLFIYLFVHSMRRKNTHIYEYPYYFLKIVTLDFNIW